MHMLHSTNASLTGSGLRRPLLAIVATFAAIWFTLPALAQTEATKSESARARGWVSHAVDAQPIARERSHTGDVPLWDQGDFSTTDSNNISSYVVAMDISFSSTIRFDGFTIWLSDDEVNDNGVLDSFAGTISWAFMADAAGEPGDVVVTGHSAMPDLTDMGFQDAFDADLFQLDLDVPALLLDAGDYWFAIHEGQWGDADDDSPVWWQHPATTVGVPGRRNFDEQNLNDNWETAGDSAFVLYGDGLDQSQSAMSTSVTGTLAQSFKPSVLSLSGVSLLTVGSGTEAVSASVWDELPNDGGVLLAEGGVANASLGDWVEISWQPIDVDPSEDYFIVLPAHGFSVAAQDANPYADGQAYEGAVYTPNAARDLAFRTWATYPIPFFADGFESGETDRWTKTVP